ncbi:MAG: hypothetical protein JRD68_00255 [Deltaproteobacteria bacterium]|nr:hypothetical protein [Deltaproteobacteria bacterium]
MDSTEKEFYEYEYDIPEWFQKAWAWLLNRYPRVKPMPSDQTYWSSFHNLDHDLIRKAIHGAATDSPDWFPKVEAILGVYSILKRNSETSVRSLEGPPIDVQDFLRKFKALRESITMKGMEVEARGKNLPQETIQRCDLCAEWKGVAGQAFGPCRWAWNDQGTMLASSGGDCENFEPKKDEVPF